MKAKELKEYKNRLAMHETPESVSPCLNYVGLFGYPNTYLDREATKDLRQDTKERSGQRLPGCNFRATYRATQDGYILTSYYTDVAKVTKTPDGYKFEKLWFGFSVTTLKHVNVFRGLFNLPELSKYEWIML